MCTREGHLSQMIAHDSTATANQGVGWLSAVYLKRLNIWIPETWILSVQIQLYPQQLN